MSLGVPELNLHREGRGRPLICLHGVGHHWQAFRPVLGRLAAGGHQVLAVDLPGFGRSAPLPGDDLSIPAYTEAIGRWIRAEGLEGAAVIGNSMGGAVALELARRGLVSAAVAVSPAGFWTDAERRYCQLSIGSVGAIPPALRPALLAALRTRPGRIGLLAQNFARPTRVPADEAQLTLRDLWASLALEGALEAFARYRYPGPLSADRSPRPGRSAPALTVCWGSRDRLLPYSLQAPRARRELPEARHVTLPGLGHVPFWDDPGMVSRVILGVLGGDGRGYAAARPR